MKHLFLPSFRSCLTVILISLTIDTFFWLKCINIVLHKPAEGRATRMHNTHATRFQQETGFSGIEASSPRHAVSTPPAWAHADCHQSTNQCGLILSPRQWRPCCEFLHLRPVSQRPQDSTFCIRTYHATRYMHHWSSIETMCGCDQISLHLPAWSMVWTLTLPSSRSVAVVLPGS